MNAVPATVAASVLAPRSQVAAGVVSLLGAVGIVTGALGANGERSLDEQVPWLNLAVVSVVVAGSAQAGLLVSTRRVVSLRLAATLQRIDERRATLPVRIPASDDDDLVTWDGHAWVHRSWCFVAAGRTTRPFAPGEDREACPVCTPDSSR